MISAAAFAEHVPYLPETKVHLESQTLEAVEIVAYQPARVAQIAHRQYCCSTQGLKMWLSFSSMAEGLSTLKLLGSSVVRSL